MHRLGKKGVRSNKSIRATRDNTYTDRHFFTYGIDSDGKIFYGEPKYCTLCGERMHCKGIIHEMNSRIRGKNYAIEKRREKNHINNEHYDHDDS